MPLYSVYTRNMASTILLSLKIFLSFISAWFRSKPEGRNNSSQRSVSSPLSEGYTSRSDELLITWIKKEQTTLKTLCKLTAYWERDLICSLSPDCVSFTLIAATTLLVGGTSTWDWCCCDDPAPCPGPGRAQTGGVSLSFVHRWLQYRQKDYQTIDKTWPVPGLQWTVLEIWVFPDTTVLEIFCHTQRKVQLLCTQASACWFFRVGQGQRGFAQPSSPCLQKTRQHHSP